MKIKSFFSLYSAVIPLIFFFVSALNKALFYLGFSSEIKIILIIAFCVAFYISSDRTVPYILNFSFYQWSLYYFLRLDNYRFKNYITAFICGLYPPAIPLLIFCLLIFYGPSEPTPTTYKYLCVVLFLWTLFRLFSIMVAYFMNPQIEGFQFMEENQKLDEITWENVIHSMHIVSMHFFKKPIKNCIDPSRSKYALTYIAKRSMYRWVLTKSVEALKTYHEPITAASGIVIAGSAVFGLSKNSDAHVKAAQISAESQERVAKISGESQERVAKISGESQERVAKINFETAKISGESQERVAKINFETAKINAGPVRYEVDKGYSPWWWFKKGTSKPENTTLETVSNVVSEIIERV